MEIKYNNLYTHFVFITRNRKPVILEENRERIEKFITGVLRNYHCKLYAIYANPEHIHFLISRNPKISEQYIATIIEDTTTTFINENKLVKGTFKWQTTASAFSVSKRDVSKVCNYIMNQKEHHKKVSFEDEFKKFMDFYQKTIDIDTKIR